MGLAIDPEKILLRDRFTSLPEELVTTFSVLHLQWAKDNNIETLVDVRRMSRIAQDMDLVTSAEEQKLASDVRAMTIDIENPPPTMCDLSCLGFEMLSICDTDLIIGPPLLRVTQAEKLW